MVKSLNKHIARELNDLYYLEGLNDLGEFCWKSVGGAYRSLNKIVNKNVIDLISKSIGMLGFQFVDLDNISLLNKVAKKLGIYYPAGCYITLDYKTGPLPCKYQETTDDKNTIYDICIPDANENDQRPQANGERKTDKPERRRLDVRPMQDYLGCFFYDPSKGSHLVLRVARILDCSKKLGVKLDKLWGIVLIYEIAHLIHITEEDCDGVISTNPDNKFAELTTQFVTWNVMKGSRLQNTFETLSNCQSPVYQTWQSIKNISLKDFRDYLSLLRETNIPSKYEIARKNIQSFL